MSKPTASPTASPTPPPPRRRDFVTIGLLIGLILLGLGVYVALKFGIPRAIPIFLAGLGLILVLSAANRRHRHANAQLRRSIDFATTAVNASLLAGILLVFNARAFVTPRHPVQHIGIDLDGRVIGHETVEYPQTELKIRIPIRPDLLNSAQPIQIGFSLPDAISPESIGLSDTRVLALGLLDASFESLH